MPRQYTTEQKENKKAWERKKWSTLSDEQKISYHLIKRHKLTYEQWIKMFEDQNYECYLCDAPVKAHLGNSPDRGVVDHNHDNNQVRKILCHNCNRTLGLVKERKDVLKRMMEYL